jgi:hypothetical protein
MDGQPTRGVSPVWRLGELLTDPHRKSQLVFSRGGGALVNMVKKLRVSKVRYEEIPNKAHKYIRQ